MAPNNKEVNNNVVYTPQDAAPYNEPAYKKTPGDLKSVGDPLGPQPGPSSDGQEEAGNEDSRVTRITTRARHTYELDRYTKNAMLILNNNGPHHKDDSMKDLIDTFQKYRFEIESYDDWKSDDILSACAKFFNRDFTQYGSVAVVILTTLTATGQLRAKDGYYNENDVFRYLVDAAPPTLQGKPKIYITELNRFSPKHRPNLPADVLTFDIPISIASADDPEFHQKRDPRPLQILCRNIERDCNKLHLMDIVVKSIDDIICTWPVYCDFKINVTSTLRKELHLAKTVI